MVSTDPIADMLTRIRNAALVGKHEIRLPHSRMKETVAKELVKNKFLRSVSVEKGEVRSELVITLCEAGENARFTEINRLSKPGRRLYTKAGEIPKVKNGRGIVLLSTSKGIMNGFEAAKARLGGELICKVY